MHQSPVGAGRALADLPWALQSPWRLTRQALLVVAPDLLVLSKGHQILPGKGQGVTQVNPAGRGLCQGSIRDHYKRVLAACHVPVMLLWIWAVAGPDLWPSWLPLA